MIYGLLSVWAIHYFNVTSYLKQGFYSLPQAVSELWKQLALGEENLLRFSFFTGKFFALTSFLEVGTFSFIIHVSNKASIK